MLGREEVQGGIHGREKSWGQALSGGIPGTLEEQQKDYDWHRRAKCRLGHTGSEGKKCPRKVS